ncbi:MAG: hypothetical protein E6H80_07885 [Betaproteobacteria bacterium]|nr:MAG: hypothetical protein E6H80_07885 [Betaproteobacteria bacterium]
MGSRTYRILPRIITFGGDHAILSIRYWRKIIVTASNLTPEDFDWLRQMRGAADAKRNPPPVPMGIIDKLGAFGFIKPDGLGGFTITVRGREALLDQNMRDAEDR